MGKLQGHSRATQDAGAALLSEFVPREARTPAAGVLELLKCTVLSKEQVEYLKLVRQCSPSLLSLLDDVLVSSGIEAGELRLVSQPLDHRVLAGSVVVLFRWCAGKKGLWLRLEVDDKVAARIAKQMAEGMRGQMGVESIPGKGPTFWFELPLALSPAPAPQAPQRAAAEVRSHARPRILVAEDSAVYGRVLSLQLRKLGCDPHLVADGVAVLRALEASQYDLILMDCQMPRMDGWETARRIRKRDGLAPAIIALTGHAREEQRQRCLAAGMDEMLTKPVSTGELQRIVSAALAARLA
ncbi:MAG: response regulator [Armatimonadetes bacterium]|nr:response regulator [Armatimonadota bacterium]